VEMYSIDHSVNPDVTGVIEKVALILDSELDTTSRLTSLPTMLF